jgi:hypothetical protein
MHITFSLFFFFYLTQVSRKRDSYGSLGDKTNERGKRREKEMTAISFEFKRNSRKSFVYKVRTFLGQARLRIEFQVKIQF